MSTHAVSIRPLDTDDELAVGQLVDPQLVVASFTPALSEHARVRAVFGDGVEVAADVLLESAVESSLVGLDLDRAIELEPVDLAEFQLPPWPFEIADRVRFAGETLLGRGTSGSDSVSEPGSVTPPGALFAAAAAARIRSPFCWLFPRSKACR